MEGGTGVVTSLHFLIILLIPPSFKAFPDVFILVSFPRAFIFTAMLLVGVSVALDYVFLALNIQKGEGTDRVAGGRSCLVSHQVQSILRYFKAFFTCFTCPLSVQVLIFMVMLVNRVLCRGFFCCVVK